MDEAELDYAEGLEILRAGDPEGARDALRFALEVCHDNLWVHAALGKIAEEEFRDPQLARAHFGCAVELVRRSLPASFSGRLPPDRPANRPFFDSARGLVRALQALGKGKEASDLQSMIERLTGGGDDRSERGPARPGGRPLGGEDPFPKS